MANIPLIVHLADGGFIVGTLVSFKWNLPVPTFCDCAINQFNEAVYR